MIGQFHFIENFPHFSSIKSNVKKSVKSPNILFKLFMDCIIITFEHKTCHLLCPFNQNKKACLTRMQI